jgi:hypothetical protein
MNLIAVFAGPYAALAKWGVIALLCAAIFGFGWVKGNQHGTGKLTEYQGAQAVASAALVVKQGKVTERIVTKYVKVRGETQTVTQTVEKEVVRYAESNPGLCLDADWRRLHDAAALNTVPDGAARTDGEGGAPPAATALATVADNYAACHRAVDRLDSLQEWVREQAAISR